MRLIWTTAGYAALVNAQNNGTNAVRCAQIAVGTGTNAASKSDTTLQSETKRIDTISGQAVDSKIIHIVYRDESSDTYTIHEIGLIAADGTLLARYAQSDAIAEKAAGSIILLPIDAIFDDIDTTQITFPSAEFVNPPWGEDTQGVVERATRAEAEAGTDNSRGMSPLRVWQGIAKWFGRSGPAAGENDVYPINVDQSVNARYLKAPNAKGISTDEYGGIQIPPGENGSWSVVRSDNGRLTVPNTGDITWLGNRVWTAGNTGKTSGLAAQYAATADNADHASSSDSAGTTQYLKAPNAKGISTDEYGGIQIPKGSSWSVVRSDNSRLTIPDSGDITWLGNRVWTAGNTGKASGLAAQYAAEADNASALDGESSADLFRRIMDSTYPVGRIVWFDTDDNPADAFGMPWSTWNRHWPGRFLISADGSSYKVNQLGGEAQHTLSVDEMPKITPSFKTNGVGVSGGEGDPQNFVKYSTDGNLERYYFNHPQFNDIGGGQPHNNMPPWAGANVWVRAS